MRSLHRLAASTLALAAALPTTALAQSTGENAVASAEDAFGTFTGHEQIGVYDEGNVRGFSPGTAGNYRMEGMYFDIQGSLGNRAIEGSTIRVGPAAQGYAFPAPTGIVDLQLKKAGEKLTVAPFASVDSFGSRSFELDAQVPLAGKELTLAAGVGIGRSRYGTGGGANDFSVGVVPRWRPSSNVEVLAFLNHRRDSNQDAQPLYFATGSFIPAYVARDNHPGPDWAKSDNRSTAYGLAGHANLGDWTVRAGVFRSRFSQDFGYANLVGINADTSTDRMVYAFPGSKAASWSGELRLSRRIPDGSRAHLITASLRGRSIDAHYGGGDLVELGSAALNQRIRPPRPAFTFGAQTDDETRQVTAGISYSLRWDGIGEVTAGVQRSHYVKRVATPGAPLAEGTSDVTLPSFSAAVPVTNKLALYGSYVRGLEDAGTAPGYAANANQVLPAIRTSQYDFGLRWSPVKDTTLILGYFHISKPYIDLDVNNAYRVLGSDTHEGIELSLTSNVTKHLRIVAGGVWQDPRVTASSTIAEPVGKRPVGLPRLRTRFNVNWTLPFAPAVTLDAYVNHESSAYGTVDNAVKVPGATRVGAGARYRFTIAGRPVTARVGLYNIFDTQFWVPVGGGYYGYNVRRNVQAWLTTEF